MKDLDGKVAIVTGAGRIGGIGQGAALELAKWGVRIVATDVARRSADTDWDGRSTTAEDMTGLHSLVEQVESVGSQAIALSVDVTNAEDASGCVEAAVEAFGQVDILVNNAGVPNGIGNFLKIPDSVWEMSWQVNVMGMVRMSRAVVPVMKPRGGGSIINNASVAGIRAMPETAAYATTKFAVIGLTRSIALDLGSSNIRCNAICPGDIISPMSDLILDRLASEAGTDPKQIGEDLKADIALGRRGTPADVGRVVAWLASDSAGYVNGAEIRVDGGWAVGL